MRVFVLVAITYLFQPLTSAVELSYWIDASCGTGQGIQIVPSAFQDAIEWYQRARARVDSATDTQTAANFQRLFRTPKTDQGALSTVQYILGQLPKPAENIAGYGISAMHRELHERRIANVRVYCDNDAKSRDFNANTRWKLAPDPPQQYQPPGTTEWVDNINGVRMHPGTLGCPQPNILTLGETYAGTAGMSAPGQPIIRGTMTPLLYLPPKSRPNPIAKITISYPDLQRSIKLPTSLLRQYPSQGRHFLRHDAQPITVANGQFREHDLIRSGARVRDTAYGFEEAQYIDRDKALNNPDNYAFFALLAKLADRKFRLSKKESEAKEGKLVYDLHGITSKRDENGGGNSTEVGDGGGDWYDFDQTDGMDGEWDDLPEPEIEMIDDKWGIEEEKGKRGWFEKRFWG
ncbi:MAG: hypothetical protein Q9227_002526 [Pyrenula ochraceoflavens]